MEGKEMEGKKRKENLSGGLQMGGKYKRNSEFQASLVWDTQ